MSYVVLYIEKAAGPDAAMSGHIERRITSANIIMIFAYLNEELVEFPKGVTNRKETICTDWIMSDWNARSERTK